MALRSPGEVPGQASCPGMLLEGKEIQGAASSGKDMEMHSRWDKKSLGSPGTQLWAQRILWQQEAGDGDIQVGWSQLISSLAR